MTETPVPWADNQAARLVLNRLRARRSATTVELQSELPLVHVARQVWELRHWYGHAIRTRRLPNGVALYILDSDAPVGAASSGPGPQPGAKGTVAAPSRAPEFGDINLIRAMRRKGRRR